MVAAQISNQVRIRSNGVNEVVRNMNPIDVLVVCSKSGLEKGKGLTDGHVSSGSSGFECVKRSINDSEEIFQRNRYIFFKKS